MIRASHINGILVMITTKHSGPHIHFKKSKDTRHVFVGRGLLRVTVNNKKLDGKLICYNQNIFVKIKCIAKNNIPFLKHDNSFVCVENGSMMLRDMYGKGWYVAELLCRLNISVLSWILNSYVELDETNNTTPILSVCHVLF